MMLMKSSTARELASSTPRTISATRSSMWSRSSVSSWVAPRTARTDTLTPHGGWAVFQPRATARSDPGGIQQYAELPVVELAQAALVEAGEANRPDLDAGEASYGMADVVQQPPHD